MIITILDLEFIFPSKTLSPWISKILHTTTRFLHRSIILMEFGAWISHNSWNLSKVWSMPSTWTHQWKVQIKQDLGGFKYCFLFKASKEVLERRIGACGGLKHVIWSTAIPSRWIFALHYLLLYVHNLVDLVVVRILI